MPSDNQQIFSLSVKSLVEFTLRSGSLTSDFTPPQRAVEGTRIHKQIQASRPPEYAPEVSVAHQVEAPLFPEETGAPAEHRLVLKISGRIDGIYEYPDRVVVDEIKTTYRDLSDLETRPHALHWGQAKVYAHILAEQRSLPSVDVQLTYFCLETGETREIVRTFTRENLSEFFHHLVSHYLEWLAPLARRRLDRDRSIRALAFPFDSYRPGQREMAVQSYLAVKHGGRLLVQAPTGIGKTAAAVFPGIKALGEGLVKTLVYLTARTTGRLAAEDALALLRSKGLKIQSLSLTAKEKICPVPDLFCRPEACPYAIGYYDRLYPALQDAAQIDHLSQETVTRVGSDHRVCPFELSLETAFWVDMVIGDYNYVFDPFVYLKRFFLEHGHDYAFLVDEAHHLVDRGRDMFSARIEKKPILDLARTIKADWPHLAKILMRINKLLVASRKECESGDGYFSQKERPVDLINLVSSFQEKAVAGLLHGLPPAYGEAFLALYLDFSRFVKTAGGYDETYSTWYQKTGDCLTVTLFCLDPSPRLNQALKRGRSAVFFSATLTPQPYYRDMLGCRDMTPSLTLPSPFPPERLALLVEGRISTRFRHREQTKEAIAQCILDVIQSRRGNYLVFFPSHAYLALVYDAFQPMAPTVKIIRQEVRMDETQRDSFLRHFDEEHSETLVGFAVMGGIFGEGIDLAGDRLTGAVIVGVGLPAVGAERELIREHFADSNRQGFEYAYLYPGFTRVMQAVGRVIRSEKDRGVVLLIDQRFGNSRYRRLFPDEWRPRFISAGRTLPTHLQNFWSGF